MKLATKIKEYIDSAKLTQFSILSSLSLTSDNSLRVILNRLVKKREIYNPIKGVYVSKNVDMFWLASQLYPGYISLSTAFYLHNLIEEFPFTIFVASNVRKTLTIGNFEFVYFKAYNYYGVERKDYLLASVEKAIS
ncbi:MAG: type IV toxin-antitoxin system AbiEi family antitoxin domain-containing protein, partial [Candidatus Micrarchaeia archaeon]